MLTLMLGTYSAQNKYLLNCLAFRLMSCLTYYACFINNRKVKFIIKIIVTKVFQKCPTLIISIFL